MQYSKIEFLSFAIYVAQAFVVNLLLAGFLTWADEISRKYVINCSDIALERGRMRQQGLVAKKM